MKLPRLDEIAADPVGAYMPEDIHFQYVVAHAIVHRIRDGEKAATYQPYVDRMHVDMQAMFTADIAEINGGK